jgi:uncharacterized protein
MNLDYVAASLADAGIASLVFDHRGFGASTGPRGDLDPEVQIEDYRVVLTLAGEMEGVDPARLGVWGTSYSGGHVLCVAARDERVRAVVSQVPTISGSENLRRRHDPDSFATLRTRLERERAEVDAGAPPTFTRLLPELPRPGTKVTARVAPPDPVDPWDLPPAPLGAYDDEHAHNFYEELGSVRLRTWENRSTLLSVDRYADYEPGQCMAALAPTPLLVIIADEDTITPTDLALDAAARAGDHVEVFMIPGGHYNAYAVGRPHATRAATAFFARHLGVGQPGPGSVRGRRPAARR